MTITKKSIAGATLATTAAMLFAFAPVSSVHAETEVMCMGINACKGQGACKTADNACAGQNACKGHGVVKTTAADCDAKGGSVAE
jgi:hypothetical protein